MSFQSIIAQDQAIGMLRSSLRNQRLSHAYLFSGPSGTGKRRAAMAFAQAIYCTELDDDACGHCIECRKVEHGNHPDLQLVEPDGQFIKIDQIRTLQRDFAYRTSGARHKVYVIVHADRMTMEAANSLLKFLEEPTHAVVAVLVSDNGHAVLPTLQSRSQWVSFVPMSPKAIYATLKAEGATDALALPAAHLVSGIDAAREIIQLNWFAEIRNVMIKLMKECLNGPASASIAIQTMVIKTELSDRVDTLLDLLVLWFKDMINVQSGRREQLVFVDQEDWLARQAYTREASEWIECMEVALDAKRRLRSHVSSQLALEQCFIRIIQQQDHTSRSATF